MHSVGMHAVVVHGGGPQISELMARLGKEPEFRDGLRVTDAETLDIARMVLVGKVNRDIVSAINVHGPLAVGLSGEDAGLIVAAARDPELGFVGDVDDGRPVDPRAPARRGPDPGRRRPSAPTRPARRTTSTPTPSPARSPRRSAPRSSSTSPTSPACSPTSTTRQSLISPHRRRRARRADRRRHDRRRDDPEDRVVPRTRCATASARPTSSTAASRTSLLLELFTDEGVGTMVHPDAT